MALVAERHFCSPDAEKMDVTREEMRARGKRLIYDCHLAAVDEQHRVRCRKGVKFVISQSGTIPLLSVLRGMTPSECRKCHYYEGED